MRIVGFATFAAIVYGILHDQVTAHLCVEYFTIAHPPIFSTESPFLLALSWGIVATWWVGLLLGVALAGAARLGALPKLRLGDVRRPILLIMIGSGLAAALAGAVGAALVASGVIPVLSGWDHLIPGDKHVAFSAVAWAHTASYGAAATGAILVIIQTVRRRFDCRRDPEDAAETCG